MIPDISQEVLDKINNPLQLPANHGDPHIIVLLTGYAGQTVDISNHIESGSISSKYDDYVYNLTLNIYSGPFSTNPTIFQQQFHPGAKLNIYIYFGDDSSNAIPICFSNIDEVNWTAGDETFTITGRNNIGHFLKETNMGQLIEVSGLSHEVVPEILEHAGIYDYDVTIGTFEWTYNFQASDTTQAAVEEVCKMFPMIQEFDMPGFRIAETPSGKVIVGYPAIFETYLPCRVYEFDAGRECFSRNFRLASDECYSYVYANGKDEEGIDLAQVVVEVENHDNWYIPANKIYFANFNGATDQVTLHEWAEKVALDLQTPGDTEDYTGPIRPQITVGDIGQINGDGWSKQGVITSITHHIGKKGYSTDFTIDSGGIYNAMTGWSSSMRANGYNRRQKLADMVRDVTEQEVQKELSMHDPIVVEETEYDDGKIVMDPDERNKMKVLFNGTDWVSLVELSGGTLNPRR